MSASDNGMESEEAEVDVDVELVSNAEAAGHGEPEPEAAGGDSDPEDFDITLPPSHSYLSAGLVAVAGRALLEPGWSGRVPCLAHHSVVFPGESVPMLLLPQAAHAADNARHIVAERLFGLLCPDETGGLVSNYGVVCEVLEVDHATPLTFKARAHRRFRLCDPPRLPQPMHHYERVQMLTVCVLPDVLMEEPLRDVRLASLDPHRRRHHAAKEDARLRRLDAALTAWPRFVYDMFDSERLSRLVRAHFEGLVQQRLPADLTSLSFWAASNMVVAPRDRFALFVVDDVLQRLHMLVQHMAKVKRVLSCASCGSQVARLEHVVPMSSEGLHSTFCNVGGHLHDVLTVSQTSNVVLTGGPSEEFSWFPGYAWSIAVCGVCMAHIGWRFDACKRGLRPQHFWAVCRNYVQPRALGEVRD